MNTLNVEYRKVEALIPYARNPRTHSDAQITKIAASIVEYGWTNPVLVDGDNGIIAGHGRLAAARKLGLDQVPVIELAHLTTAQKRALVIADNRLALDAGWDEEMLALELAELSEAGFELALTGFENIEIDALLADAPSTEGEGDMADMVFTDPPYNVNYANSAKDKMRGKDRAILNDNLGDGFYDFLLAALTPTVAHCRGGIYVAMSSSELDVLQAAFRAAGGKWSTFIIWAKNTFTLGRADYQRQYEPILYGWPEGAQRHWCGDRDQGDVWAIKKPQKNDLHPTMKPVELVERAIRNSSRPGNVVLDPFGGSGTTLIAAEKSGRVARLIELDPKYVDVIVRRWEDFTGQTAIREAADQEVCAS
ncbi:site-specific DNA-methyltransferase [Ralstonia mannitolilytica]|uniref:site-specific DNA-methyltransferase n=1 Tax=Ralstonia mannitolilytica TaxID=105219 RepID=UPI0028F64BC3|nr:site-specific DNA-methyltransferase [Ralstonia mannitolilytica]CAJ0719420.1 hypothetical protein LMG8323_04273 [Ralstonia mannitolilytica]